LKLTISIAMDAGKSLITCRELAWTKYKRMHEYLVKMMNQNIYR